MKLVVGNKIVYPCQGPCLVASIVNRTIDDRVLIFYQLVVLNGGGDLFVPVDKVESVGIRMLLKKTEIPRLLDELKKTRAAVGWKQRSIEDVKLFASGSAFDLAEIIESLTELSETKDLSAGERNRLDRAKRLLVCEVSEVMGETREEAERQVDIALRARKESGLAVIN